MSRCLYLEYGAGCGCSECMSGNVPRSRSPIEVETERLRVEKDERLGRAREDALEARVAELEYLIADHEFEAEEYDALAGRRISICPVCGGHGGHHTHCHGINAADPNPGPDVDDGREKVYF